MSHTHEIHNALTGEIIRPELTADEIAQAEADKAKAEADKARADEARDRKRQKVLDRLGITAEELKTILS